ncbi:Subtilisin-like protease 5.4, partial [Cucurbita argyrosperma subsp. sororia]
MAAKKSYIVYLGSHSHGLNPSTLDLQLATQTHYNLLLISNLLHKPTTIYLDPEHLDVVSVCVNKGLKLHTTRSWNFLGVQSDGGVPSDSLWNLSRFGESTIIGNLDTGVRPESKSFSDEGYEPIPTKWKGRCEGGSKFHCNGSLTSNPLKGSPKALVAAYKACWPPVEGGECFMANILAAFEAAISDGVDVLLVSLGGGPEEFYDDPIAIESFHAVKNGITVVCSAGNSGPSKGIVENVAPWMITVGASTIDMLFTTYVMLGDKRHFKVKGKIVVCLNWDHARVDKGYVAAQAGAVGMILVNDVGSGDGLLADAHLLSASHLSYTDEAVEIKRRVKNVGSPSTYVAQVKVPPGVSVSVDPNTLKFTKTDEEKDFKIVLKRVPNNQTEEHVFGKLVWFDGKHRVSSPIFVTLKVK